MRSLSFTLVLALASCGASSDPGDTKVPTASGGPNGDSEQKVPTTFDDAKTPPTSEPSFACRLPAPVSSDDACSKDADCAPSSPCHARACVAVGKATPRTPDTVCTMNIDCQSADVNPCSCYEGRCALVPKSP
jgi:hypothetical protein